ncbi:hypothetical protein EDD95_8141 [Streptomyces sp. CEV 2-1]|uniref:hypothetical protein n=1 Tax=Streptomyces sp. CEV 2-1 TaxID=2485153 RepID=UPI000F48D553|nr:hypothetical protein [Streptomyces sp. CEV 2-1]ROQ65279.1 hypothetical protein EDD95_8141 [Streptomyces sp. CEV 2-1]
MARNARPVTHYMATRPDGTVPPTSGVYVTADPIPTVNFADHIGQVVDHPTPGKPWYDETAFSYFRTYTRPGELLERVAWPARLWVVEPLGETGTWGGYSYWVLCHQLRVVEEAEPWHAFGHRGKQVMAVLAQLPDLVRQWADQWAADSDGTHRTYKAWEARVHETRALTGWASCRSEYSRRGAALRAATTLAADAATQAATEAAVAPHALAAIQLRARCLAAGQLMFDRIRDGEYERSIRAVLLGTALDSSALSRPGALAAH